MFIDYFSRIMNKYKKEGIVPAARMMLDTYQEYLALELFTDKADRRNEWERLCYGVDNISANWLGVEDQVNRFRNIFDIEKKMFLERLE